MRHGKAMSAQGLMSSLAASPTTNASAPKSPCSDDWAFLTQPTQAPLTAVGPCLKDQPLTIKAAVGAWMWRKMAVRYAALWTAKAGVVDSPPFWDWLEALGELDADAIRRGVEKSMKDTGRYAPDIGEFIARCELLPSDLGLPDVDDAFRAACQGQPDWQALHPIVFFARREIGAHELRNATTAAEIRRVRGRFERVYADLVREAAAGRVFEYPVVRGQQALAHERFPVPENYAKTPGELLTLLRDGRRRQEDERRRREQQAAAADNEARQALLATVARLEERHADTETA